MNRFIVAEPNQCIGCRTCEVACALAHMGSSSAAALSPTNFAPRLKVVKSRQISVPVVCRHCEDAPCANACPNGAIVYRANSVQVLQDRCVGCKTCMVACPFGAMDVVTVPATQVFVGVTIRHGVKAEAHKCDLCVGRTEGPACVKVCPTKALHLVDRAAIDLTLNRRQERAASEAANSSL